MSLPVRDLFVCNAFAVTMQQEMGSEKVWQVDQGSR